MAPSRRLTYAVAAAWLILHWPFLAPSLEDIDSINFALGLHLFDPALHQPHPPGYPVFIALGRLALAGIHQVAPALWYVRADALALAIWSAIGGAIAIVAGADLFRGMTADRERAPWVGVLAALLMAVTPLFWLTGLRPMSDMFGLGAALAAQALLLRGADDRRALVTGAIVAGLAAGIRSQTVPLTLPMFVYALVMQRRAGAWLARPLVAFVVAALAWAVPLIVFSGGVAKYLQALGTQGAEDFAWVDMLWAHPAPKAIAFALYDSVVLPFGTRAIVVPLVAAAGALVLLLRDRRALLLLAIGFVPYAIFHLLFQETANLRYATPLVVPIAFLFTSAIAALPVPRSWDSRRAVPWLVLHGVAIGALTPATVSGSLRYGRTPHPAFRAITEMTAAAPGEKPAAVFSHYALRRPLQAAPTKLPVIDPQRNYEWLAAEEYWLKGGTQPVWFLADPVRSDLALIDPQVRNAPKQYRWLSERDDAFMGTRPMGVDWYRFARPPGWFAGEGWDLTPETAGIARTSGKYLQKQPITAYVRRRPEPVQAIIAGRDLGPANDPSSIFEVAIDGTVVDTWRLDPAKDGINFFRVLQLPQGIPAGVGNYAALTITARAEDAGTPTPQVAVEQFDLQSTGTVMFGFGDGWQEAEYDRTKGLSWRWTSDRAALRILGPGDDVVIELRGESPLKYFDSAPTLTAKAGTRTLSTLRPTADFTWTIAVPAAALTAGDHLVTIETDKVYLPGKVEGTADARRLGLRIFDARVATSHPAASH